MLDEDYFGIHVVDADKLLGFLKEHNNNPNLEIYFNEDRNIVIESEETNLACDFYRNLESDINYEFAGDIEGSDLGVDLSNDLYSVDFNLENIPLARYKDGTFKGTLEDLAYHSYKLKTLKSFRKVDVANRICDILNSYELDDGSYLNFKVDDILSNLIIYKPLKSLNVKDMYVVKVGLICGSLEDIELIIEAFEEASSEGSSDSLRTNLTDNLGTFAVKCKDGLELSMFVPITIE